MLLLFTKWFYILLYSIVQLYIVPLSFQFKVQQFNTHLDNCLSMSCYTFSLKKRVENKHSGAMSRHFQCCSAK